MKWRFLVGFTLLVLALSCNKKTNNVVPNVPVEADIATIDEYLKTHGITNVVEDTTGLRYVIHTLGTGVTPTLSNCIRTTYRGYLLNGSEFDSNTTGFKTLLGTSYLILGWRIAFQHFPKGTKATMYIPSGYAYQTQERQDANGNVTIPPNSILVFDVELLDVYAYNSAGGYCYSEPLLLPEQQLAKDVSSIDSYLATNGISAQTDPSGLRYTIQTLGTGPKPTSASCIKAKYTGKLLSGGTIFDSNSAGYKSPLIRLIKGWQVGLGLLPKGTKATLYIPSGMAYGPTGSGSRIPENANLIFEIELVDVTDYNATTDTCDQ
jgi:FKBP-type peptidyl-prolyl cis-trans isomerase